MKNVSAITLGTMRFQDKGLSVNDSRHLLDCAKRNGITTLHTSPEYSSYNLLKEVSPGTDHQYIVKIAAPHFDEENFSQQSLERRVEGFLKDFNVESIDVAQWMWRMNPLNDDRRIKKTQDQLGDMQEAFQTLIATGKVKQFSCFPYTPRYMHFIREKGLMHSQTNYLNYWEDDLFEGGIAKDSIALRPLAAGRCRKSRFSLSDCLSYPLSHPNIKSTVVSLHSVSDIEEVASIAGQVKKSEQLFNRYREKIA